MIKRHDGRDWRGWRGEAKERAESTVELPPPAPATEGQITDTGDQLVTDTGDRLVLG